jgi:mono/diheme cytochrome c family protein
MRRATVCCEHTESNASGASRRSSGRLCGVLLTDRRQRRWLTVPAIESQSLGWRSLVFVAVGLVLAWTPVAFAQQPPASGPFAPGWRMLAGFDVFAAKGCGQCHSLRGMGPVTGPDLARVRSGTGFYDIGAALWNHLPRMNAEMRQAGMERQRLTARETTDLIAFLFTAQYRDESGDAKAGERLFASKGCAQCHAVGGVGGGVGPALDPLKRANSPVLMAAAMWNHGPAMADTMRARGITRPTLEGKELLDIIAYVTAAARDSGGDTTQIVPGTPATGEKLFSERRCATCHAVAGKGGRVGPDLGRSGHHVSLTEFSARMWNHGPKMWAAMKARGIDVPKLSGQDTADILAYLYVAHYFDPAASAGRGAQALADKGCTTCHSVNGQGGKVAADFATSIVVGSSGALIAGMWNHGPLMEAAAKKQGVSWPLLQGRDLADITAYLNSLGKRPAGSPASK